MTLNAHLDYDPSLMEGWTHKAAFVIQFRLETDIGDGRFEGRIEHIASTKAMRFHSLDELPTNVTQKNAVVITDEAIAFSPKPQGPRP